MKRVFVFLVSIAAVIGSVSWAQSIDWGPAWREATAEEKAAFFDRAMTQLHDESQPAAGDDDYTIKAKRAYANCFASEKFKFAQFSKIIDARYDGNRNICRPPVTTIRGEITDACYPYLKKALNLAPSPDFPPCS